MTGSTAVQVGKPWRVLIVAAGSDTEMDRDVTSSLVGRLGFVADMWDRPGYPGDITLSTDAASVEAVRAHEGVIAILGRAEGTQFRPEGVPPQMIELLRTRAIVARGPEEPLPTVLEVEVLYAISEGMPTVILVPESVRETLDAALRQLRDMSNHLVARSGDDSSTPGARSLIEAGSLLDLWRRYDIPDIQGLTFRHIAFLRHLESRNWCHYYRTGRADDLEARVTGNLGALGQLSAQRQREAIDDRMGRRRDPLASESLSDLFAKDALVHSPYVVRSGYLGGNGTLLSLSSTGSGELAKTFMSGKSVLLVGEPGVGKSTTILLAGREAVELGQATGEQVLCGSWRSVPPEDTEPAVLVRDILGQAIGRDAFPAAAPLFDRPRFLVLDGLDEGVTSPAIRVEQIRALADSNHLLASCRRSDIDSGLRESMEVFDTIVELPPWGEAEQQAFIDKLRMRGMSSAADFLMRHFELEPGLWEFPLWLSLAAYAHDHGALLGADYNDYDVLLACGHALAEQECDHCGLGRDRADDLVRQWAATAYRLNQEAGRDTPVLLPDVLSETPFGDEAGMISATKSLLSRSGERIFGFEHEVLGEYWLARYIIDALADADSSASLLLSLFATRRSILVNRLVRRGLRSSGAGPNAARALRELFDSSGSASQFVRNQVLYLLGRIDESEATRSYLSRVWRDRDEQLFVRYSAAWAAIIAGDEQVEEGFFQQLRDDPRLDDLNRAYHRVYYGDETFPANAEDLRDDGGPAERSIAALLRRLKRGEPRHIRLRRIEYLTLHNLVTSRRHPSAAALDGVAELLEEKPHGRPGQMSAVEEIAGKLAEWQRSS